MPTRAPRPAVDRAKPARPAAKARPPRAKAPAAKAPAAKAPAAKARPSAPQRDAGATRERILAAAEHAFAAHGLRGARVQEIVARAGVNQRMLYHHFGDKDGLYRAVVGKFVSGLNAQIDEALDPAASPEPSERFAKLVRSYFDAFATHPTIVRVTLQEALAGWTSHTRLQLEVDEDLQAKVFAFFAEGQRPGAFRDGLDLKLATIVAASTCLLFPILLPRMERFFDVDLADPAQLAAVRERILDVLLHGVVAGR